MTEEIESYSPFWASWSCTIEKLTVAKILFAFFFLLGEKFAAYGLMGMNFYFLKTEGQKIFSAWLDRKSQY